MRLLSTLAAASLLAFLSFGQGTMEDFQKALQSNPKSSMAHYGLAAIYFRQGKGAYQASANESIEALRGDHQPEWTVVWSHITLGKIFDITGQRDRAVTQYNLAIETNDDT